MAPDQPPRWRACNAGEVGYLSASIKAVAECPGGRHKSPCCESGAPALPGLCRGQANGFLRAVPTERGSITPICAKPQQVAALRMPGAEV